MKYWEIIADNLSKAGWSWSCVSTVDFYLLATLLVAMGGIACAAASGKPIGEPMNHEDHVWSAQFSPDGQRVVTASMDNTVRLWDAVSGKPVGKPMKHHDTIVSAQFSPDGQRIVTASLDNTARLWDGSSGKPIGEP